MATGARTGCEPSGAHWDHRAEARDTAGGPGRYTNTGHGADSSNIMDVFSDFLDKAQTEVDDNRHAESNTAHNISMIQQSLEDQLAQLNRALMKAKADVRNSRRRWMLRKPISWRLRRVCQLRWSHKLQAKAVASKWPPIRVRGSREGLCGGDESGGRCDTVAPIGDGWS